MLILLMHQFNKVADKGRLSVEQRIKTVLFFTETKSVVSCPFSNMMGAFIQNNS
jgi:hypothetical protein